MNQRLNQRAAKKGPLDFTQQGANVMLAATCEFLRRNNIKDEQMIAFVRRKPELHRGDTGLRQYRARVREYEALGIIMGTWFSHPKFLDDSGRPLPITPTRGHRSLPALIRLSGTNIAPAAALRLMQQSPSIRVGTDGSLLAIKRVFVIPGLDVPRAAFVIERYLNTLKQNAVHRKAAKTLLLERSCHVSRIDLAKIAPLLRNIESRGTAFMDSIDGDIEDRRLRKSTRKSVGELGVLVFAWTRGP